MSISTSIYRSCSRVRGTVVLRCVFVAAPFVAALLLTAGCAQSSSLAIDDGAVTADAVEHGTLASSPPSSVPLATAPSESGAPTTEGTDESAIRRAVNRLYGLRMACGRNPARCDFGALAAPASTYRSALTDLMALRVRHGLRTVAGHGELRWRVESVSRAGAERAVVHTCATDSLVVFDATGGEPGYVFDDSVVSTRTEWVVVRHDGVWKWSEERILAQRRGAGLCGGF